MNKEDKNYIRIPRQKLGFYNQIKVDKDIRKLIKLVNYLQKWSQGHESQK
jgi:hypothetical protein